MSLKIIDQETREELADLGMAVVDDAPARRRPHVCRECQFCQRYPLLKNYPEHDVCLAKGSGKCRSLNRTGSCESFAALPQWAEAHRRGLDPIDPAGLITRAPYASIVSHDSPPTWSVYAALGLSIAAVAIALLGGCSFPEEGFPAGADHYRPPRPHGAALGDDGPDGTSAAGDSSGEPEGGSSESEGTDSGSSGSSSGGEAESGPGGIEEGSESTGSESGASSTGEPPDPWGPCEDAACADDLYCAPTFSADCGTTSSCHICSPYCEADVDCGDGAFCFGQLGYCMLRCDGGCPDGATCVDNGADDFCSFPDGDP